MQLHALLATGVTIMASLGTVHGHGYLQDPPAQWVDGYWSNGYGSQINNTKWAAYDQSIPSDFMKSKSIFFKKAYEESGAKSLGAFIARYQELYSNKSDPECSLTVYKDSARSKLPKSELTFSSFTHGGPCEGWCDNTKLFFDYDCQSKYPGEPAKVPYDKYKCHNANRLTIYWIALHDNPWQVYTDCVWLVGGSGRGKPPAPVGKASSKIASDPNSPSPMTTAPPPTAPNKANSEIANEAHTSVDETQIEKTDAPPMEPPSTSTMTTTARCGRRRK